MEPASAPLGGFLHNLRELPRNFWAAVFRNGMPTSERARSKAVFGNFFLHIHPARVHCRVLKPTATLGLGVITAALFVILLVTGVLLMVYYKPSLADAYDSILDIHHVVPTGRIIRNLHRWTAHGMVVAVFLHMARAFYTSAYKPPREFNWLIGLFLLVLTLALSFTGYLLPWDQLAFWAITVGANIAQSPREITDVLGITQSFDVGGFQKAILLGAHTVGQEALIRFYVLHIMVLPIIMVVIMGVHFWRIRKDGGLARPRAADPPPVPGPPAGAKTYGLMALIRDTSPLVDRDLKNTIPAWPRLFYAELAVGTIITAMSIAISLWADAPLKEIANPEVPENPAKAPWYFLGLQEIVSYSAFMGGIGIPVIVLLGLALIPFLDREKEEVGVWFSGRRGRRVACRSLLLAAAFVPATLAFTIRYGWLRNWFPEIPQIVITFANPGTLFVAVFAVWSLFVLTRTRSTRLAAIALFTTFLVSFIILTYFATVHRGPNWGFYWSQASWPELHGE
ncbi:MAG: cytochrome b N-terminal domain-containing protein [Planctomycetes bacterium]|nr:cytochrome b N-terminal domain-containing protein [Planctomycetota bacterium]